MFYYDYLKSRFDLTGNILEVACGPFPTISKYIDNIFIHEDKSIEINFKEDINSIQ